MSLDDLKKALDLFQKDYNGYLELTEKILPGQPKEVRDFIESMLESLTLYNLAINRIKDGFATFKVEYDNQLHVPRFSICMSSEDYDRLVHIPRKQLSEMCEEIIKYSLHYDELADEYMRTDSRIQDEDTSLVLLDDVLQSFDKRLKELLETSEHHFLTVSEAREKLKEASKEARP